MFVQNTAILGAASLFFCAGCYFSVYTVQPGHVALKFSKFTGLGDRLYKEGWNFRIPFFEQPIIFSIQTKPTQMKSMTANRGNKLIKLDFK